MNGPAWTGWLVRRRLAAFVVTALVAGGLAAGIPKVRLDVSNKSFFVEGDEALVHFQALEETFGSDEVFYVLVETEGAFEEPTLGHMLQLGTDLAGLDAVLGVRSPLHAAVAHNDDEGAIAIQSVAEAAPRTAAERAAWRARVLAYEPFRGLLISDDARLVGFVVQLDRLALTQEVQERLTDGVRGLLEREPYRAYPSSAVGGAPNMVLHGRILAREVRWAVITGLGVGLLSLLLLFRGLRPVVGPLLVIAATLGATFGLMGHAGIPLSTVSSVLVTLLICVGLADAMHIVASYQRLAREGLEPPSAMQAALDHVWNPCLFTSLTTAAGFMAFLFSRISPVAHLGLCAAVGCLLAYPFTLGLIPAVVVGWRPSPVAAGRRDLIDALLEGLRRVATGRPGAVVVVAALLCGFSAVGLQWLRAEQELLKNLDPDEPLRRDVEFVQDRMGGAFAAEVVLWLSSPGDGAQLTEVIRRSAELEDWLRQAHPAVRAVRGIADGVEEIHHLYDGPREVPADEAVLAQLLLVLQMADAEHYQRHLTLGGSALRITIRCNVVGSSVYGPFLEEVERELERRFHGLARGSVTGGAMLLARANEYVLQTQVQSFGLALLVVSLIVIVGAREARLGLLSIVPNVGPIAFVLGLMGWIGITLNVANMLVATVTIGIIVDDTIHFVYGFRRGVAARDAAPAAIEHVLRRSGRAILATSLVLVCCTLAVFLSANMGDLREFGLLSAAIFAVAVLADLLLMPALLCLWERGFGGGAPTADAGPTAGAGTSGDASPSAEDA